MDLKLKLEQGEELIKKGNEFYELLMSFHNNTKEDQTELVELLKTDERFKEMQIRMEMLAKKLGM